MSLTHIRKFAISCSKLKKSFFALLFTFRYPRIRKETLLPTPQKFDDPVENWYPPGHGDIYECFAESGLLDQFIKEGRKVMFMSNIDNLGATVDLRILALSFSNCIFMNNLKNVSFRR